MTAKLYIRRGGGASVDTDYTSFTGQKGAPFLDENSPLIQVGMRCENGEASQGYVKILDPAAILPTSTFRIPPHALVTLTEDASGDELWLARGRVAPLETGRGDQVADNHIEHDVTVNDANMDLRGLPFTEPWARPGESGRARVVALQAYILNGSSSTAPDFGGDVAKRVTTEITVAGGDHLCPNTDLVQMPHKVYPPGTMPQEVIADCAETEDKIFSVVIHHFGGSHLCLLYIKRDNHTVFTTDVKISQLISEWDPDDLTAPVFEPHYDMGKGTAWDHDAVATALVSRWGGTNDEPAYVFASRPGLITDYEYWGETYDDSESVTEAQAQLRAEAIVDSRSPSVLTNRCSILMLPEQTHLICAGMSMQIKAPPLATGAVPSAYQTRRIAELKWEPNSDGRWWAHMQLGRGLRTRPPRSGAGQPKSTTPKPPVGPIAAACAADPSTLVLQPGTNTGFETGTTAGWTFNQISGGLQGPATGPWEGDYYYELNGGGFATYTAFTGDSFVSGTTYIAMISVSDTGAATEFHFGAAGDQAEMSAAVGAGSGWHNLCLEWTPASTHAAVDVGVALEVTAGLDNFAFDNVRVYRGGSGTSSGAVVGTVGGTGSGSADPSSGTYLPIGSVLEHQNITTGGPYHESADITYDNGASGLTADDVQAAIDELATGVPGGPAWVVDANAAPYSAVPDDATDASAAFTSAIADAVTAAIADGGRIAVVEADPGIYEISGALITTSNRRAQIPLPTVAATDPKVTLVIRPKHHNGTAWTDGASTSNNIENVVLHSTLTGQTYSGTFGWPTIMGGPDPEQTSTISNLVPWLEGITFRQAPNPSLACFMFYLNRGAVRKDCRFDTTDDPSSGITEPTNITGAVGFDPANGNNAICEWRGMNQAIGYYLGFPIEEHTKAEKLAAYRCKIALNCYEKWHHAAEIEHVSAEHCSYVIASADSSGIITPGGTGDFISITGFIDIEDATSGWAAPIEHINDPGDVVQGVIQYIRVIAGSGTTSGALSTTGCTNLVMIDLADPSASFGGGGAPTTADYLVGTAQGGLSAEIVVGTTPGGELGNTWASPTVDTTHSGSAHADFIAKAFFVAKGDLIGASANDTPSLVTVGTDGDVLTADSGATAGVSWQAPSGGAAGHYEVIVDGVAPPVAVTNEAEDDWLYGFVPD